MFLFRLLLKAAPLPALLSLSKILKDMLRGAQGSPGAVRGREGQVFPEERRVYAPSRREARPYTVLGCSPSSSNEEIKPCRELLAKYHPDKFIGPESRRGLCCPRPQGSFRRFRRRTAGFAPHGGYSFIFLFFGARNPTASFLRDCGGFFGRGVRGDGSHTAVWSVIQ